MTVAVAARRMPHVWRWLMVPWQACAGARGSAPARPPAPDPARLAARVLAYRRWEARTMLARDPVLAAELRVGRPDLPRVYNDGGLVDVNHVPAVTLMSELALSPAAAEAVVAERNRLGGFAGADELLLSCAALTPLRDRLVFVPL
jgi:hypothetical protein